MELLRLTKLPLKCLHERPNFKRYGCNHYLNCGYWLKNFQNRFLSDQNTNSSSNIPEHHQTTTKCTSRNEPSEKWVYVENNENLPKLPVPPLQQTMQKYKEKMKILLNEEDYLQLEKISQNFLEDTNLGPKLQQFLLDRQQKLDNWLYDYWVDDMYYSNNASLPVHSHIAGFYEHDKISDVCHLGAKIVSSAVKLASLMRRNLFPNTYVLLKRSKVRLCVDQFYNAFRTCRIPGKDKDSIIRSGVDGNYYVIVISRNSFYYVTITIEGDEVDEEVVYHNLYKIKNDTQKSKSAPVGILTTLKRREWWAKRECLLQNSTNKKNLTLIENALLVLCLDESEGTDIKETSENDRIVSLLKQTLYGGKSEQNSGNRWHDKSMQVILSESFLGYSFEHSCLDGPTVHSLLEELYENANKSETRNTLEKVKADLDPIKLNWDLEDEILERINTATTEFDKLVDDLDIKIGIYKEYGSNFIKSRNCSPDGFFQLVLQLSYFKLYGKLCSTYESCSTRMFRYGRYDCLRPTTKETLKWVLEMVKSEPDSTLLSKLWKDAMNSHSTEIIDISSGSCIDGHLLGLLEASKKVLSTVPELFSDKSYAIAKHFVLSTGRADNASSKSYWLFGPVVNNGYGISYTILPDSINMRVTAWHSCTTTSSKMLVEQFEKSLDEVVALLRK